MRMRKRKGFTLIELLIVMAVIAALIATLTPVGIGAVKRAKATQVVANLRGLASAAQQYIYTETPDDPTTVDKTTLLNNGYIDKNPGDEYSVEVTGPTDGKYTITVHYTGGDVDKAIIEKIDSAINADNPNDITYVATVVKYW